MPTYEYKCTKCNNVFEAFQKMTDEPIKICPKCGGPVKRIIGAGAGPIFKGSGFYHTDYKNKNSSTDGSGKEKKGSTSSESSKESKSSEVKKDNIKKEDK